MRNYIEYTADHEEPLCHRCDNADMKDEFCEENCGAKHGWFCCRRTEKIEDILNGI